MNIFDPSGERLHQLQFDDDYSHGNGYGNGPGSLIWIVLLLLASLICFIASC